MRWANKQGLEGIDTRVKVAAAADIGTVAHAMVEAHIQGHDPLSVIAADVPDYVRRGAAFAFDAYERWAKRSRLIIVATELHGVDEEYQTGWCLDALSVFEGEEGLELLDWKSSNGTYADHFIQISTYAHFFERASGLSLNGAHLCRFGKTDGEFVNHHWPRHLLDEGWEVFKKLRALHNDRRRIEGLCR